MPDQVVTPHRRLSSISITFNNNEQEQHVFENSLYFIICSLKEKERQNIHFSLN